MKKEIFKNYEIKIRPIKIIKFNLRWRKVRLGLPSFFLSHTSFSTLFETLSGSRCSCITYQHKKRVIRAFESPPAYCSVCGHACPNCGSPKSEQRRKAVHSYLKMDPTDLGCKVRDHEE